MWLAVHHAEVVSNEVAVIDTYKNHEGKKCSFLCHFCRHHYFVRPLDLGMQDFFPPCILVRSTFTALTEPSVPVGGPASKNLCSLTEDVCYNVRPKNLHKYGQT